MRNIYLNCKGLIALFIAKVTGREEVFVTDYCFPFQTSFILTQTLEQWCGK